MDEAAVAAESASNAARDADAGLAPSYLLPTATATCVEYPGFVQNTDACLRTLGQQHGNLQRALATNGQTMELKWRADDPMAHAVVGDRAPSANLLLRVRRPRRQPGVPPPTADQCEVRHCSSQPACCRPPPRVCITGGVAPR